MEIEIHYKFSSLLRTYKKIYKNKSIIWTMDYGMDDDFFATLFIYKPKKGVYLLIKITTQFFLNYKTVEEIWSLSNVIDILE